MVCRGVNVACSASGRTVRGSQCNMCCVRTCVYMWVVCVCMHEYKDVLFPGTGNTKSIVVHSALIWTRLVGHEVRRKTRNAEWNGTMGRTV